MDTEVAARRSSASLITMSPEAQTREADPSNTPEPHPRVAALDCSSTAKSSSLTDLLMEGTFAPSLEDPFEEYDHQGIRPSTHSANGFRFATHDEEKLHIARLTNNKSRSVVIRVMRMNSVRSQSGLSHKSIDAEVLVPTSVSSLSQLYTKIEKALKLSLPVRELIPLSGISAGLSPDDPPPTVERVFHLEDKQLYYVTTVNDPRGRSLYNKIMQAATQKTSNRGQRHYAGLPVVQTPPDRSKAVVRRISSPSQESPSTTPTLTDKGNEKTPLSNRPRVPHEVSSLSAGAVRVARVDSLLAEDDDDFDDDDGVSSQGFARHSHHYPKVAPSLCEPRNKTFVIKVARVPRGNSTKKQWIDFKILNNMDTFEDLFPALEKALRTNMPVKDVFTENGTRLEHFSELSSSCRYLVQTIADAHPRRTASRAAP